MNPRTDTRGGGWEQWLSPLALEPRQVGDWAIECHEAEAGAVFYTANHRCALFGGQAREEIVFPEATTWHKLVENHNGWMSDIPCEQAQMRQMAAQATGKVLVGGLGLGLLVWILQAERAGHVSEIVVVEKSPDVVALVGGNVAPAGHWPASAGARIITADIAEYLRQDAAGEDFDAVLLDTWGGDNEETFFHTVLPLRRLAAECTDGPVICWQEEVMRGQLLLALHAAWGIYQHDPEKLRSAWEGTDQESPFNAWKVPFMGRLLAGKIDSGSMASEAVLAVEAVQDAG